MLTNKAKYGLKAMVYLSHPGEGELAVVNDIARVNNIPKKFLDAIMAELRNAGFVHSRKGKSGGYYLEPRPVVRVLDGATLADIRDTESLSSLTASSSSGV